MVYNSATARSFRRFCSCFLIVLSLMFATLPFPSPAAADDFVIDFDSATECYMTNYTEDDYDWSISGDGYLRGYYGTGANAAEKSRCDNPPAARFPLDREVIRYLKKRFGS